MGPHPGQPETHGRRCKENISVLDVRCSFLAGSLVEQGLAEIVRGTREGDPASSGPRCDLKPFFRFFSFPRVTGEREVKWECAVSLSFNSQIITI